MTTGEGAPAWRGGFGRMWTAAVVSRFGDALRSSALPLPAARLTADLTTLQTLFDNAATALLVAGTVQTSSLLLMGSVRHLGALVVGMLLLGAMNMVWNVHQVTLMQQRAPGSMAGRIAAAFRTSSTSGAPLGALLGGA